jgi:hypothetical protein
MYCNKNEATKSYERRVNGKRAQEYYCIECYEQLFLDGEGLKTDPSLSACPYCGTTLAEFKASSLVGCPYCYRTLLSEIAPFIVRMQGDNCGHRGKRQPLSLEDEALFSRATFVTEAERDEYRDMLAQKERFSRQNRELQALMTYSELDGERREEYRDKLERMKKTGKVEDEIVW